MRMIRQLETVFGKKRKITIHVFGGCGLAPGCVCRSDFVFRRISGGVGRVRRKKKQRKQ